MAIKFVGPVPKTFMFADLVAGDTFMIRKKSESLVHMKTSIGAGSVNSICLNTGELHYMEDEWVIEPVDLNIEVVHR